MPWAATMTSALKIPARTFTQLSTGEFDPNSIDWTTIVSVPCRVFPVSEQSIQAIWGQTLQVDAGAWIAPDVVLPPAVLSADSGSKTPVQIDGIQYMVLKVVDLGHLGKMKAVALRRFSHG